MGTRPSDDDRQRASAALEQHTGDNRLTLDEFGGATSDRPTHPAGSTESTGEPGRELYILFAVAAATLVLLAFFIAMLR